MNRQDIKFCRYCGRGNHKQFLVCDGCGAPLYELLSSPDAESQTLTYREEIAKGTAPLEFYDIVIGGTMGAVTPEFLKRFMQR